MRWSFYKAIGAVLLLVGLFAAGCESPPQRPELVPGDYSYTRAHGAYYIRQKMRQHNLTGVSIALVDDQEVIWATGFGYADRAAGRPATETTVHALAVIGGLAAGGAGGYQYRPAAGRRPARLSHSQPGTTGGGRRYAAPAHAASRRSARGPDP